MPARLHFSNSLDALAERLRRNLKEEGGDPFVAPVIATPASALRDWLKIRLAEADKVAVNLSFPPLETLLWDRLAERDAKKDVAERQPARLLDTFSFQGLVLARLRENPPDALRAYLASPHHEDSARRLCQLSGQLASLFREYEYNRVAEQGFPGLTESWMAHRPSFEPHLLRGNAAASQDRLDELRTLEIWQLDVYHSLFRRDDGLRDRWGATTGVYRYTLPQYAALALDGNAPRVPPDANRTYHLFGLSNISPFHRDLIGRLADEGKLGEAAVRFEIYALNPCAEFWEDALTLRERRARGRRTLVPGAVATDRIRATRPSDAERESGMLHDDEDENGLLALFGKPGRETIKLWCQLTGHDFLEDFREPAAGHEHPGDNLLHTLQQTLLHRLGPFDANARYAPAADDRSLRFGVARDARAELEAVRAEIATALKEDETLRPEDLAVIPVDLADALPLLRAVFAGDDRAPGNVPVLLPDGGGGNGGGGEGPYLAGFRALLDVATGELTRGNLTELLANPAVLKASGLEVASLPVVDDMLEAAGFTRGWGNGWVEERSGAHASTIAAATERLLASLAFDAEAVSNREPVAALDPEDGPDPFSGTLFPQPVPGLAHRLDASETGLLLDWLSRLQECVAPLRDGGSRTFDAWAGLLRKLRDVMLSASPADAGDVFDLRRFLDELEAWSAWSTAGTKSGGDDGTHATADATLISMLFADRFREPESAGRIVFLRGGVRVGTLSALRGIPFRRVWVTGMTSAFPASSEAMPLDLRAFRRLPGESDPAARDLYALLEVLATCTDAVSLSWHARATDGKDRQPSRALTGMMAWLERDVLTPDHPFGFASLNPPRHLPPPRLDHSAVAFAQEPSSRPYHPFRDVGNFLCNPAVQAIRRLTQRNEGDVFDDAEPMPSEDLFVGRWQEQDLLEGCLRAELMAPGSARQVFAQEWETRRRGGRVPPAPWGDAERERLQTRLQARLDGELSALRAWMDATGMRFVGSLRLGPQGLERAEAPVVNLPAFDLNGIPKVAGDKEIHENVLRMGGILPWFFRGPEGWAMRVDPERDPTPYLVQLCATALSPLPQPLAEFFSGAGSLITPTNDGASLDVKPLPPVDVDTARLRLRDLMSDFLRAQHGDGHLDDVPLEEVAALLKDEGGDPDNVRDWIEGLLERRDEAEEQGQARYTRDQRRRRAIAPELPDNLEALIHRRALPYLAWMTALDNASGAAPDGSAAEAAEAVGSSP